MGLVVTRQRCKDNGPTASAAVEIRMMLNDQRSGNFVVADGHFERSGSPPALNLGPDHGQVRQGSEPNLTTPNPFFADALGAIDGTHIFCTSSAEDRDSTRDRKGNLTQNCLAVCSFDMLFLYFMSGWEGSAHDLVHFHHARRTDFSIPEGKYYLADAGFASSDTLLVPYRGVRYHLSE